MTNSTDTATAPAPTTSREVDRYYATLNGTTRHGIGPAIVTVVETIRTNTPPTRPSYSVLINGEHAFGWCGSTPKDDDELRRWTSATFILRHDDAAEPAPAPDPQIDETAARYDDIVDALVSAGFQPMDAVDIFDPTDPESTHAHNTTTYFARRGWDAVRHNGDSLTFARFDDDGAYVMTTTLSGCIMAEARFGTSELDTAMFAAVVQVTP